MREPVLGVEPDRLREVGKRLIEVTLLGLGERPFIERQRDFGIEFDRVCVVCNRPVMVAFGGMRDGPVEEGRGVI